MCIYIQILNQDIVIFECFKSIFPAMFYLHIFKSRSTKGFILLRQKYMARRKLREHYA